ncbi:hypothetical protein IW261DRAFT_1414930 [Armillaria novae-zelandiae]|uniref:Uncharacterized protein n=1 Tax=Armillaria novae-zelandiae TaxID=153914 RepID=A0AA39PPA3_9AGAR|nr:hypothetical protein IW261DRAFT_1414930 [Armillaria novae-zelandiae]
MVVPLLRTFQYASFGVPTLAKIKAQHILKHLKMSLVHGKYYVGLESLFRLQEVPPQPNWTSARVDKWVINVKGFWEHCKAQVDMARISSKDFQGVEYEFLQLLLEFPDEKVVASSLEYNKLVNRAQQYSLKVFPLPLPETFVPLPPSRSVSAAPLAPLSLSAISSISQVVAPSKVPSSISAIGPQPPKLTLLGPRLPVATLELSFRLDPTSPFHPAAANTVASLPSGHVGTRHSQGLTPIDPPLPSPCPISPLRASTPPAPVLPDLAPVSAGTDDEDEPPTPGAIDKGKSWEIILGTDEDEDDFLVPFAPSAAMDVDDDEASSPPPTNIAWHYCSPIFAGANPIPVSELLGAPSATKPKRTYKAKAKFSNPPPGPNDSAVEGIVTTKWSSKKASKVLKEKQAIEVPRGEVIATKVNRPRGPSWIRLPLTMLGVQGGGFGEEVPSDYKPIVNGLKSIGVLVVSRDFGNFVEVDKALWNKKVALFIGEQEDMMPQFLDELESINAFKSAMTTLTQHANNLEDVIVNYLAGLDAMSQLQGLQTQISHLRECLGSDTRVEEVVEEDNNKGYNAGEVAEGEAGPSRKCKHSQK